MFRVTCRQTAPYSAVPDSDNVPIKPRLRHRTPSAWMRFCVVSGSVKLETEVFTRSGVPGENQCWPG